MTRPDISVVIVSYNTSELTRRCLRELDASRTPDVAFDVTVVDNASADGSADAIAGEFPGVRLIRLPENVGWGRAINRGAVATDGTHLLFLNPDTAPVGNPVAELGRFARKHSRHGLYTGRTLHPDGTDDMFCAWGLPTLRGYLGFATGLSTLFPRSALTNPEGLPGYDRRSVRVVPAVSGCCMLIQRKLFERLGGFDPQFFLYSDDIDLCTRAAELGARPVVVPQATVIHVGGASSSSSGQRLKILRGKSTYVRRHWTPWRARTAITLMAAGVALRAVGQALRGRGRDRAVDWPSIWRDRDVWSQGWPPVDEPRPPLSPLTAQSLLPGSR
ncbi:glycosyltransferase family 2 protein [Actinoplanes rectilineatus]|uniref:glycosyltransferase family 2 protein n=1 Tax=Actinoplanes rectilineatus TaxID=113571 RepID=UPI0005F2EA0A|nr:glycosyltransferase family 2 protein [Actinoplanes rectilineatus]